jgi:hypothetical protein
VAGRHVDDPDGRTRGWLMGLRCQDPKCRNHAYFRDMAGKQRVKTFPTKREPTFVAEIESD